MLSRARAILIWIIFFKRKILKSLISSFFVCKYLTIFCKNIIYLKINEWKKFDMEAPKTVTIDYNVSSYRVSEIRRNTNDACSKITTFLSWKENYGGRLVLALQQYSQIAI